MNAPVHSLQTARLDLEPTRAADADEAWPLLDDPRIWQYFPNLRPASLEHLQRIYERRERGAPEAGELWENWTCRDRKAGALVGEMQITITLDRSAGYLAYAIYPRWQRRGYAREAAHAVIAHVRDVHGVKRLFAEMDVRNEGSFKLAESLGFARVATRLAAERGDATPYGDEYLYELIF